MDIRVQTIVELINQEPSRDLSLVEAAEKVGLSPCHLDHLFSEEVGVSFKQYVIQCRLRVATELLRDTFLKVIKISQQAGWQSPSYFNHCFKQHLGMTPLEYRRQHHQKNAPRISE